ncbi:type I restriction enzyme S subunit [Streptosporangium album]|uniref:Type I restriction enzyme S subunit n=1 Tax=Streptosporangium album TaxID=47479 RepID=A0A7W7WDL4_9ACTN|nr:restriction endonuclease subunit S [Streptosporangium album]MBB4942495.1 type I restriction enzyme S subunit [Streptosporangium album]
MDIAIKRVARVRYGLGQPPKLSSDGIPILRATNVFRGSIVPEGLIFAALKDLPLDRAPLLQEGEILVVRSGAYAGDSALVTPEWAGSAPGYDLRLTPERMDPRFLAYCLLSTQIIHQIDVARSRAAQPHLNAEELGEVTVPWPALEEQRRITDFLDGEVARIEKMESLQRNVLVKLDERDRAFLDLDLDRLGSRHGVIPLRRAIRRIEQGSSPLCDNIPASEDEWGVLKVSSVKHGRFWPEENKRLPAELMPERRYEIKAGDLLVTRANTPLLVGAAAVVPEVREKLMLCDKIFRIDVVAQLDRQFIVLASRGTRIRDLCGAASHGTSQSMSNLKTEEIKEWPIPNAGLSEQREVVKRVKEQQAMTGSLRSRIGRQLKLLAERKQALITAAVTGRIDVTTARGIEG